ncbi:hypothetical protein [Streptomyces youssoufiensis]
MASVRLVAPEPRIVPWLGSQLVQPDQVVDVPDDQVAAYTCQPAVWELVGEPKKAPTISAARRGSKED